MAALSQRAYARHRRKGGLVGGTLKAVQKAIARGWIHTEPNGRIEPDRADREWAALHVPRVSIYRPGTRRRKDGTHDRPDAKGDEGETHPLVVAHNELVDLIERVVGGTSAVVQETVEQLPAGVDPKTKAWPALWAEERKFPAAVDKLKREVMAILLYAVQLQPREKEEA